MKTVNVHVEKIESAVQTVDYVPERKTTRANKGIESKTAVTQLAPWSMLPLSSPGFHNKPLQHTEVT